MHHTYLSCATGQRSHLTGRSPHRLRALYEILTGLLSRWVRRRQVTTSPIELLTKGPLPFRAPQLHRGRHNGLAVVPNWCD